MSANDGESHDPSVTNDGEPHDPSVTNDGESPGRSITNEAAAVGRALGRVCFGDRVGFVLWLGLVLAVAVPWQVGVFISDTYTVANALANVADGHLAIREVVFAPTLESQPGLYQHDGKLYGRNYGQVFAAVPVLLALRAATAIGPLHLVLAAGWSVGVVAFTNRLAAVIDREWIRGVGATVALLAFAAAVGSGAWIEPRFRPIVALQLVTIVAAAFAGVLGYRLLGLYHDRSVAIAGGVTTVLALPVVFWASVPKRHVLVATLVLATVYGFALSRHTGGAGKYRGLALAYVAAGLITWIHAFEGFFVLGTLLAVDLSTAGVRDGRRTAVIACAIAIGLLPALLTNAAISGDPLQPPRLLAKATADGVDLAPTGDVVSPARPAAVSNGGAVPRPDGAIGGGGVDSGVIGGGGIGSGGVGSGGVDSGGVEKARAIGDPTGVNQPSAGRPSTGIAVGDPLASRTGQVPWGIVPVLGVFGQVATVLGYGVSWVLDGLAALAEPGRLWHVFVRSGSIPGLKYSVNRYEAIDLAVLESAPLLGGLLAAPVLFTRRVQRSVALSAVSPTESDGDRRTLRDLLAGVYPWQLSGRRQTDLLVAALVSVFTVVYLPTLPVFSQITVRYLLPVMPLGLYGVLSLRPVRRALEGVPRAFWGSYATTTVVATVAVPAILTILAVARGEAMQFHALLNLGAVLALATHVGLGGSGRESGSDRSLAIALGATAGLTTSFLLLAGVEYFQYGTFPVALGRWLAGHVPVF